MFNDFFVSAISKDNSAQTGTPRAPAVAHAADIAAPI
jgi:hypothetical protein